MKLLFTEGIGASQTTTNAQDEKIPVYETKTAAETDLANLEVGQVIATKEDGNELVIPAKIGEHNGIFRGKCLNGNPATMYPILPIGNTKSLQGGGYTIEQVMANIAAGNFDDIYIGDYFIDSENKVYRIGGLDTELNKGDTPLTSHHAVIVTDFALTNMGWNLTNTTAGGYQASAVQDK